MTELLAALGGHEVSRTRSGRPGPGRPTATRSSSRSCSPPRRGRARSIQGPRRALDHRPAPCGSWRPRGRARGRGPAPVPPLRGGPQAPGGGLRLRRVLPLRRRRGGGRPRRGRRPRRPRRGPGRPGPRPGRRPPRPTPSPTPSSATPSTTSSAPPVRSGSTAGWPRPSRRAAATAHPARPGRSPSQYHRSRRLPGAERGVEPALRPPATPRRRAPTTRRPASCAWPSTCCPTATPDAPGCSAGSGSSWPGRWPSTRRCQVAAEAGRRHRRGRGQRGGRRATSPTPPTSAPWPGAWPHAWALARQGLDLRRRHRDVAWARLVVLRPPAPGGRGRRVPGHPHRHPRAAGGGRHPAGRPPRPASAPRPWRPSSNPARRPCTSANLVVLAYWAGEYRRCLPLFEAEVERGRGPGPAGPGRPHAGPSSSSARRAWAAWTRRGDAWRRTEALAARLGMPILTVLQARRSSPRATGRGLGSCRRPGPARRARHPRPGLGSGLVYAWTRPGRRPPRSARGGPALPRPPRPLAGAGPGLDHRLPTMACHAAEALWVLERHDHRELVERALREKVSPPTSAIPWSTAAWPWPACAPSPGRHDEAAQWFAEAREVLDEQGARPLLAICDYDEALMYARGSEPGDAEAARAAPRGGPGPVRGHRHERLDPPGRRAGRTAQGTPGLVRDATDLRRHG